MRKILAQFEEIIKRKKLAHSYLIVGDNFERLKDFVEKFIALCIRDLQKDSNIYKYRYLNQVKPISLSRKITVEAIRDFYYFFNVKAEEGFLRIGVIWECDRMNVEAQNAFLKTLEEPNLGSLIIMVSDKSGKVLPTIRSRCQLISIYSGISYNFKHRLQLESILSKLLPNSGAEIAMAAAKSLNDIFEELTEVAEENVKNQILPPAELEGKTEKKEREDLNKAILRSEFLGLREIYISFIVCWFSQLVLLKNGVEKNILPNPDFFNDFDVTSLEKFDVKQLEYQYNCCLSFAYKTNGNVKDEFLVNDFALQITKKL